MMRFIAAVVLAVALSGCASTGADPRDPYEPLNRDIYAFNEALDQDFMRPLARAYRGYVHEEIRSRVRNFFANIADLFIGVNNMLQGKFEDGFMDWTRFAFNSTFGLLGLHDVASDMGIEKHNEDFGQTFGRWGAPDGAYLMLPLLGPSTVRDGIGTGFDMALDPLGEVRPIDLRNPLIGLRLVNTRADLLDASRLLEEAALDRYVFLRDAYLQRRRNLIHDGRPPRERGEPRSGLNEGLDNTYLPRIPRNYEAVLAATRP
ncbi:MAG TPA: VacJ family lipoprotein [Burkholderiales bacterium]|nr:VacJ family lipoprotein [Burkholderiales bacterium]